jgi:glycosyltransferase involved in cell wall biosynthesis
MLVTIIVPVYNVERYITRCFNSIIKQTYQCIECIFVDDCSPDNSRSVLERLISEYSGHIVFTILKASTNMGLAVARNTGIHNAKGEYLYLLDSDDEITEACIETLVNLAKKYKNVDVVQGQTRIIPPPAAWQKNSILNRKKNIEYSNNTIWIKRYFYSLSPIWNKLIRTGFLRENDLYFACYMRRVEDVHFCFFASKKIKSIAFAYAICYIYYSNISGSITQNKDNDAYWLLALRDMTANIDIEIAREQKKYICVRLFNSIRRIAANNDIRYLMPEFLHLVTVMTKDAFLTCGLLRFFGLLLLRIYPSIGISFVKNIISLIIRMLFRLS